MPSNHRDFHLRRWLALGLVVLTGGAFAACGGSDNPPASGAAPKLLTLEDLKKYPSDSPEAALMRHFFFIQWGGARNLIASLDPEMAGAVGAPALIDAYSFLRPALAASKLRIIGKMDTDQGTLVLFEASPVSGPSQPDSVLFGKVGGSYVIRYDTQLDRAIPGAINAATAGQPASKQGQARLAKKIADVLDRYHAAAGAPAVRAALRRASRAAGGAPAGKARAGG
ncbi:MAG: hypothetical protein QOJ89_4753 [bacterium]|jgi:hypothetical protein